MRLIARWRIFLNLGVLTKVRSRSEVFFSKADWAQSFQQNGFWLRSSVKGKITVKTFEAGYSLEIRSLLELFRGLFARFLLQLYTQDIQPWLFVTFIVRPAFRNWLAISAKWVKCSSKFEDNINMSSKYTWTWVFSLNVITTPIGRHNVCGALVSQNGINLNWYKGRFGTVKAVLARDSGSKAICRNASFRSIFEMQCTGGSRLINPSKMGIGYACFTVTELNFRASRQNLTLPGLTIKVTGEDHGDVGSILSHSYFSLAGDKG